MTRILIADDHPLFRVALRQAIAAALPETRIDEADTLPAVEALLERTDDVDLVMLDLHMPGSHGLVGLAALRSRFPSTAVAMVSAHADPAVARRALAHGAAAYIPKSASLATLTEAIHAVFRCEEWLPPEWRDGPRELARGGAEAELAARLATLTAQQFRVLTLVAEGRLNKQIADALGVQERTVKAHLTTIFEKLGVHNRTQAGVLLRALELSDPAQQRLVEQIDA